MEFQAYLTRIVPFGPLPLAVLALTIAGYSAFVRRGFLVDARWWWGSILLVFAVAACWPFAHAESAFHGRWPYSLVVGCVVVAAAISVARIRGYFAYNVRDTDLEQALREAKADDSTVRLGDSLWPVALQLSAIRGKKAEFRAVMARVRESLRRARRSSVVVPVFHLLVAILAITPLIVAKARSTAPYQTLPDPHTDFSFSVKAPQP